MTRLANWQTNLSALIEDKRNEPFDFPKWNCLMWASSGIEAVNGSKILAKYEGKYKTQKAAAKLLRKLDNVTTSQALLEKHLGELRPIAFARHGDIVLADENTGGLVLPADLALFGPVPGVCYGPISYFAGEQGLIDVPTLQLGHCLWVS